MDAVRHVSRTARLPRPLFQRIVSIVAALLVALFWSYVPEPGYGAAFALWLACLIGYASSFPAALERRPSAPLHVWLTLSALLALAAWLRLYDVYGIPANISIDELLPGAESRQIANGIKPNVLTTCGWFTIPNFTFVPAALLMKILPVGGFHALRLASALTGLAGIAATFLLAARLLGPRAALAASFFMAVSFWHLHNSRTGFPYAQSSFAPALVLYLLVRAQQDRSELGLAVAGLLCGFALQMYFPVRLLMLVCPMFFLAGWLSNAYAPRAMLRESLIFGCGALIVLMPLILHVGLEELTLHSSEILLARPEILKDLELRYHLQGLGEVFERNLWEASRMFTHLADVAVLNLSPAGILGRTIFAMFLTGVALTLLSGRLIPWLLLTWFLVAFVFGVAFTNAPRASYRLAAAMPAIYMLAGYTVDRALAATEGARAWYRYSVRMLVILLLAAWVGAENYRLFFFDYVRGDGKPMSVPEALRFMAAKCDGRMFYLMPKSESFQGEEFPDLFCGQHRGIDVRDIPSAVDTSQPATFIILMNQFAALNALSRCYPNGVVRHHRGPGGGELFQSVEVSVEDLLAGPNNCPPVRLNGASKQSA